MLLDWFIIILTIGDYAISALPTSQFSNNANLTEVDPLKREMCANPDEEFVSPMESPPKCCSKCPAGTGMLQLCTKDVDTVCRTCQDGAEFSPDASATAKCHQCRACQDLHPFARIRNVCTPTTDAVCECVEGYFFMESKSKCQSCTKCPVGQGAVRPCDWSTDSSCKACAEDTFSPVESATDGCQTCRKCRPGYIEMRPCSATQNALCCLLNDPACAANPEAHEFDYDSQSNQPTTEAPARQIPYGEDYPMITIYCSLLGLIILTLLLYVIFKLWKQRLMAKDAKKVGVEAGSEEEAVNVGDLHPGFVEMTKCQSISASNSEHNGLSGKQKSAKLCATVEGEHLLGEPQMYSAPDSQELTNHILSPNVLSELSNGLAANDRWKEVGSSLGYSDEALQRFESVEVDENADRSACAARRMLTTWFATRPAGSSAVKILNSALEKNPANAELCQLIRECSDTY